MHWYVIAVLALAGCGPGTRAAPVRKSIETAYQQNRFERRVVPALDEPDVLFVADNQLHNPFASPYTLQTDIVDRFVPVAVRPAQLNLFGQDLLHEVIARHGNRVPIVHLGDGLDAACTGEMTAFLEIMRPARLWVMAPGNHDFNFMGNEHASGRIGKAREVLRNDRDPDRDVWIGGGGAYVNQMASDWCDACAGAGCPLPKPAFLRWYLHQLAAQSDDGARAFGTYLASRRTQTATAQVCTCVQNAASVRPCDDPAFSAAANIPATGTWQADANVKGFLRRVAWRIDDVEPWKSYLVQEVEIPSSSGRPVHLVITDTNQYSRRPTVVGPAFERLNPLAWLLGPTDSPAAGASGSILDDQRRVIASWLNDARKAEHRVMVAGHHPLSSLRQDTGKQLRALLQESEVPVYYSAHTHTSFFAEWSAGFVEINVGSVLDAPAHYMLSRYEEAAGKLVVTEHVAWMKSILHGDTCPSEWRPRDGDPDGHLTYRNDIRDHVMRVLKGGSIKGDTRETHQRILRAQLSAFRRLLTTQGLTTVAAVSWPFGCDDDACVVRAIDAELQRIQRGPVADSVRERATQAVAALASFEATRTTMPDASGPTQRSDRHRQYRACQAIWAAEAQAAK